MATKYWISILVEFCLTALFFVRANEPLHVCLPELGCLQGKYMPGLRTEKFEAFLGIPFAKPPIGELRFQNPEPVAAWNNSTLDATKSKPQCLQKNYFAPLWPIFGAEDCLYLNIYRPIQSAQKSLPVIFYIHGGCLVFGSIHPQLLGPEHFMDTGEVILVMVTYRLGPFGFLASGDEVIPGNFGLKDQNLALQWVNQYITAFGGDAKRITIAGHSSGASSVQFHMLYELSKGLFARAITMSGSALAPYVSLQSKPLQVAIKLAQTAGIANAAQLNTTELLRALQTIDSIVILNAGDAFKSWFIAPLVNFSPNIEQANWKNAFITEEPEMRIKSGNFQHVPWMTGFVPSEGEGSALTLEIIENQFLRTEFNQNFDKVLKTILQFTSNENAQFGETTIQLVIDEYFQGMHELNNATALGLRQIVGDLAFHYPFYKGIKHYLNYPQPVYVMKFNYSGPYSYTMHCRSCNGKNYGVVHIDDLLYLFRQPFYFPKDYDPDSAAAAVVQSLVGSYVEFAKNGFSNHSALYKACYKSTFENTPEGICEYVSYTNDGPSYKVVADNKFNLKRMHFLESIMEGVNVDDDTAK